jgi:flagellar biosynthetic protein FliR
MVVHIDPAWISRIFLIAIRVGAVILLSPVYSSLGSLVTVRVLFTIAISAVLSAGLGPPLAAPPDLGALFIAAAGELIVGATMAFGVFAAFGAFALAGKILDIQSGFGIGNVYDPVTRAGAPLFATMLNLLAVAVFFGLDAHLALFRGLAFSLAQLPPGAGPMALAPDAVVRQFGLMFSLGVALIVPVMLGLLLVEVALAVVSRALPQMNVFVVGVPVKIVAALALFALTAGTAGPTMGRVYASIFIFWEQVLA